jgi:hypothetical protein
VLAVRCQETAPKTVVRCQLPDVRKQPQKKLSDVSCRMSENSPF